MREAMRRVRHKNDKIVMEEASYDLFMGEWLKCYCNYNVETTTGYFFRAVLILLENQLMRSYLQTLPKPVLEIKIFSRPIRTI